ncbi:peptidase M61 [Rhodanobacter sp. Col0626]|uniref:M61 family metallopeptidase n=1 Tax=Rhodanobacter sp. Col0626 TaxID=3415679 RepID=UPI003CEFA031
MSETIASERRGKLRGAWFTPLLTLMLISGVQAQSPTGRTISVTLQPSVSAGAQRITSLHVAVQMPGNAAAAGAPLVRMPLVTSNVKTAAVNLHDLQAYDADGALALTYDDDRGGQKPYRRWKAARIVHGPLKLSYRVDITNEANPLGAAPPFELRSEGRVFSGLTGSFLLLPDSSQAYRLKLHWDLAGLGGNTLGVSTLGLGDQLGATAVAPEQLESVFLMGGQPGHEPERPAADGFFSAWQGTPRFDARALMQWTHQLYTYYLKFFDAGNTAYSVYLRRNPINPGGGVEVGHSFVGTFDEHTPVDTFKMTLAHEMVHTFVGALDAKDELAASWFSEGLAVYYQRLLPLRAGQIDRQAYLDDLNTTAARYYTDMLNTTPNDQISARFWPDTRIRVLPYDRGALYFAQVDAALRHASKGKRSLDDLVLALLHRRASGHPVTESDWVDAVTQALGKRGKLQFQQMMRGKLVVLPPDAFGRCFRRVTRPLRRYELGFTPDVLIEPRRIVRGLIPGSEAARAGIRNGDEIVKPVPQDGIQADQHARLELKIRRGAQAMDISYLPRGEVVDAYQWVESNESRCDM